MKLAIFDRDGVIDDNSTCYYVYRKEDFKFNPGVGEALAHLTRRGWRIAVVSNQSGIAKGVYTLGDIHALHSWMTDELARQGAVIQRIYVCPHHPSTGNCLCRKPQPLMLEKAMAELGAKPTETFFVGDSDTDVKAGEAAGVRTIKVEPNGDLYSQLVMHGIIEKQV